MSVREPGRPETPISDRSTVQETLTVIEAGVPAGAANPEVSAVTCTLMQCRFALVRAVVALLVAIWVAASAERA